MKIILTSSATRGTSLSLLKAPDWSTDFLKSKPSILLVPFSYVCSVVPWFHGMGKYRKKDPKKKPPAKRREGHFSLGARIESKLLTPGLLL